MLRILLFNALLLGSCGYAIWRGGPPERYAGWLFLCGTLLTPLVASGLPARYYQVETLIFGVDLFLMAALFWIACQADRLWPLFAAGLQLDTVGIHVLKMLNSDMIRVTYALLTIGWSYPILIILAIGTLRHQRRVQRYGIDRSWTKRPSRQRI